MRKKIVILGPSEENAFSLSTGDLMAGLLFIFILLRMGALLQVQEKAEQDEQIVKNYDRIKTQLYIDLEEEFKDDLKVWNAVIDSTNLIVRFQEPTTLFDLNESTLKVKFKDILDDFFPRYLRLISSDQYKDNIEEIRIEGHTDSRGTYEHNMELSQGRTRAVLNYCLVMVDSVLYDWTVARITANGLSSSHLIFNKDGTENQELSRRVEFRIRTNAEKQLEEIAEKRLKVK
ncbi:MAG: OmpA family protein [Bacteroidales bacterium]|nr:OmpA family protein [Bacteroidales bacterium]